METFQLTLHVINLTLFIAAMVSFSMSVFAISKCKKPVLLKRLGYSVTVTGFFLSAVFIYLQTDWIISAHNQVVGDLTSFTWLVFDYFLVVFMLTVSTTVRVYCKWQGRLRNSFCKIPNGKRWTDPPARLPIN